METEAPPKTGETGRRRSREKKERVRCVCGVITCNPTITPAPKSTAFGYGSAIWTAISPRGRCVAKESLQAGKAWLAAECLTKVDRYLEQQHEIRRRLRAALAGGGR